MDDLINIVKNTKQGGKAINTELKEQDAIINVIFFIISSNLIKEWIRILPIWAKLGEIWPSFWRKVVIFVLLLPLFWKLLPFFVLSSFGIDYIHIIILFIYLLIIIIIFILIIIYNYKNLFTKSKINHNSRNIIWIPHPSWLSYLCQ